MLPAMEKTSTGYEFRELGMQQKTNARALYAVMLLHIRGHMCRPEGLKHKGVQLQYRHTN